MGKNARIVLLLTLLGASSFATVKARAEPSAGDRTLAAALFREAKALMDKSDYATACAKLEESQRLDPGGGTILNLALCHERQGKPATAWGEFIEALGIARRDHRQARVDLAEEHIAKLEPMLSHMTIVVAPEADEPSLSVSRDGALVGRAAWGMPFPVDPGEHRIQAVASGKVPFRATVTVGAGGAAGALTVRVPPLERDPASAEAAALPAETPANPPGAESAPAPAAPPPLVSSTAGSPGSAPARPPSSAGEGNHSSPSHGQRVWGWSAVAVGGAGVIAGTALTVAALGKKSDSQDHCPHDPCDAVAVKESRDAGRFADFASVGFGVGLVGVGIGVILLLTDHSGPATTGANVGRGWAVYPEARQGGASMGVLGRF